MILKPAQYGLYMVKVELIGCHLHGGSLVSVLLFNRSIQYSGSLINKCLFISFDFCIYYR